ncbi:extracellular solute-binding protein [Paenibacillus thermoaerophilus]|uniref:Extracellular solute-binding protein n=1 Tax=Paenibacillus thermoaerophilus TaxID=1215385 RepID=A0ABW2V4D6_9BACL|nr:extracellular solute-binding protein [Paenibacillus thermoaerophilus]TMV11023.1 extracellular solute-binding protein [Paenibacillus thermoaerophilus]
MKKKLSALLAGVLATGALAGCSSDSGGEKPADSAAASPGAAASQKPAEKTKFSISLRTLNFGYVERHANINEDKWVKQLEEKTNVDLEIRLVPHKDYEQKMVQMFATNDLPDVVQANGGVNGKELAGSVKAGVFMPLDDLLKEHGQDLLKKVPKEAWDKVTYKGKIYAIPEWLGNPSRRATWIRMDLLEKTGLPVPKTVDEYLNVLREFKKLGVKHPFMGREDFKYADTFFGAYDVFPYLSQFEKAGDKVQPKFMDTENMTKALQTYKTMFDEGLISQEFATINPTTFKNEIIAGKAGIWSMNANELLQWEQQLKANVPEAKLAIIPSPVGPDGKGGYYLYGASPRAYFINKNAKNAAEIVKFFNWMVSDEAEVFFSDGVKDPKTPEEVDEQRYLSAFLWLVQDTTYNRRILSASEAGKQLIQVYDTILANEGRDGIEFEPRLDSLSKNPDISPNSDTPPPLLVNHMVKMVYGKEPISDWPKVIDEWLSKGGSDVIKEATEKFNNNDGVTLPRR